MLQLLLSATADRYVNFKCYSFYAQLLRYFPQASMLNYSCFVFGYLFPESNLYLCLIFVSFEVIMHLEAELGKFEFQYDLCVI